MQRQGQTTDKYTVSRMLMKTVGDGRAKLNPPRVYRAISLVERFIEMQPKDVDEVLFNALLDTCCRLKDLSRLEATVNRMQEFQVAPSPVTLGILVKTYGQAGDIQKVLQVWSDMEKQRDQANAVTYGCMIDACVKCGHLEKAVEIFQGMRKTGKHRNTILYTTLIKGYGLEKDLPHALELFREMPKEGVPYNTITFNSILDACVKCGDLPAAEGLLREMTSPESSLEPDLITFSTLLKGYCHIGCLEKALQVAEAIKARGLRCDELVYNTLMDGCVKANDITAGVGLFEEMVQNGMRPSTITHSILSKLYQHAGYEEDAAEMVAQLYQHHGIERPSGSDRSKGFGRRFNPRSPGGRGGDRSSHQSPLGSPTGSSACLGRGAFGDLTWGPVGSVPPMPGAEASSVASSAPSTPLRSPLHASPTAGSAPYLPMEALRGAFVPPLPGSAAPAGSPCGAGSLPPASFNGSLASSPCISGSPHASPFGAVDQNGFGVPPSPQAMGTMMALHQQAQLPAWPFPCASPYQTMPGMTMAPPLPGAAAGDMQQVMGFTMMQHGMSPGAFGAIGGSAEAPPAGPPGTLPAAQAKQPAVSMPIAPPQEMSCGAMGPPQAYFENWASQSQQAGGAVQMSQMGGGQVGVGIQMGGGAAGGGGGGFFLS